MKKFITVCMSVVLFHAMIFAMGQGESASAAGEKTSPVAGKKVAYILNLAYRCSLGNLRCLRKGRIQSDHGIGNEHTDGVRRYFQYGYSIYAGKKIRLESLRMY